MPVLHEHRGVAARRFIWWKLRYEWGQWVTFVAEGQHILTRWEPLKEEP